MGYKELVLEIVSESGVITPKGIHRKFKKKHGFAPSTHDIQNYLKRLEEKGLVEILHKNERGKRKVRVSNPFLQLWKRTGSVKDFISDKHLEPYIPDALLKLKELKGMLHHG
jgi:hypothetical protein